MAGVVLGSGRVGSRLCHQSLRLGVVITVVPLAVAVGLTVGELASVSVIVVAVKAEG